MIIFINYKSHEIINVTKKKITLDNLYFYRKRNQLL